MKKSNLWMGLLVIALVFTMTVVGCGEDPADNNTKNNNNNTKIITFISTDSSGNTYALVITAGTANTVAAGDSYELTITNGQSNKISKGTIYNIANGVWTMKPDNSSETFIVTTNNGQMTNITGNIAIKESETLVTGPGTVTPQEGNNNNNNNNNNNGGAGGATIYTVSFESNGGSSVNSQTINSGGTATRPTNPTRSGYTFDNWYSNSGLTTVYNFSTAITENITLYAKWNPVSVNPTAIEMVYVPGGSFEMGKDLGTGVNYDVTPVHTVILTGFYMGKYQVTQAQYQAVMEGNPSYFSSNPASGEVQGNRPVECVTWYDAIEFCNALSIKEGLSPYYTIDKVNKDPNNISSHDNMKWTITRNSAANGYRLPTEAQWEYAAKGGNGTPGNYTYSGSNTVDDVAWYSGNSNSKTHEVGKKLPNGLGIYDMSGNVYEWCWDWWGYYSSEAQTDPMGAAASVYRVLRGGWWGSNADNARSVDRLSSNPGNPNTGLRNFGFRLARPSDTTISNFSVSFESNGGSYIASQTVNSGGTAFRPTNPTRSGYTFDNWYSNSGLTTVYNFSTAVTGNITLYAKWNPVSVNPIAIEMVYVPGGSFEMGNPDTSVGWDFERPVHTVTLTGFYMGKYEVTQAQYQAVMGSNPSYFSSNSESGEVQGNRPVEQVSRYDAIVFCNKLSIAEGLSPTYRISGSTNPSDWGTVPTSRNSTWNSAVIVAGSNGYRLPTEAQWEYAAKGGNGTPGNYTYAGSNTIGDVAWYNDNSGGKTHEVGKKAPNGLGIYDMSGNVFEWCWDWWGYYSSEAQTDPQGAASGDLLMKRGGSWIDVASLVRSVYRYNESPYYRNYHIGFRLVRP